MLCSLVGVSNVLWMKPANCSVHSLLGVLNMKTMHIQDAQVLLSIVCLIVFNRYMDLVLVALHCEINNRIRCPFSNQPLDMSPKQIFSLPLGEMM